MSFIILTITKKKKESSHFTDDHMITLNNILKSFDSIKILENITCSFEEIKVSVIVGKSGEGKSTLFG